MVKIKRVNDEKIEMKRMNDENIEKMREWMMKEIEIIIISMTAWWKTFIWDDEMINMNDKK